MKKNQKYIAGATLALLGAGVLSGCQQTTESGQEKTGTTTTQTSTQSTEAKQTTQSTTNTATATASTANTTNTNTTTTYKDGTYTGTANGYRPNLNVQVVVSGGKIASVTVGENDETPNFLARVDPKVANEIVAKQTTKVTAVSGATRSSNAIMNATANALTKAV